MLSLQGGPDQTLHNLSGASGSLLNVGGESVTVVLSADEVFAGSINDQVSGTYNPLNVVGNGFTFTLSGNNSYNELTTISSGTLALGSGGNIFSSAGVDLAASGTRFDISQSGDQLIRTLNGVAGSTVALGGEKLTIFGVGPMIFAGTIQDGGIGGGTGGSLNMYGSGSLILNGVNSYTGGTTVSSGILEVGDASHGNAVLGGNVTVAGGGTLMGHGTIGGTVSNGGVVQPGGTIGALTVSGNYSQASNATLNIEITPNVSAGPGTGYDQLRIGGSANLAGALAIIDDPGTYTVGSRYTILTAAGGRSGTFGTVSYNPLLAGYIDPVVTYDPNDVYLTLDPTAAGLSGAQAVPDLLTATISAARAIGDIVLADVCGPTARRLTTQEQGCVTQPIGSYRVELWMHGLGGLGSVAGGGAHLSFNDNYGGGLIGVGIGSDGFTVGAGAGYLATGLNFSSGDSASQNAGLGFVYARYVQRPWQVGVMAAYGGGQVDGTRPLTGTGMTASGSRPGDFAVVQARAAYDVPVGPLTLKPRVSLAYIHAGQSGFSETGAGMLDLTYASTSVDTMEGQLAARVLRDFAAGTWVLQPWVEAGVRGSFSGLARNVSVTEGTFGTAVSGVSPAPVAGVAGVGLNAAVTSSLDLFLRYEGQFSANQVDNAFSAGFSYRL